MLAAGLPGPSFARPLDPVAVRAEAEIGYDGTPEARPAQRSNGISLQQAVEMALRQHQGRVVRAETISRNGRLVHEIRILGDDGRVRTVHIDAQSGEPR